MPTEIERLYREHRAGLVRLVERELHDRHDAEDVVQTAFVDAQRALERGTIPRNPRAWLAAIALNAGRRLRRRRLNAEPLEEHAAQEVSEQPQIRAALASLPREQRAAVVYRDVLGLSYGETAEQMGTSVNAVTMLLHRGRRRLRQTLGATTVGLGVWRWGKRLGMPQVAVAKGAAAVVLAGGLATTGVVVARATAPRTDPVSPAVLPTLPTQVPGGVLTVHSAQHPKTKDGSSSRATPAPASTRAPGEAVTPAPVPAATTSPSRSTLQVSTAHVPTLPIPTTPAAVTVSTPITTLTVTVPTVPTATVTTPIATVTLPIP